jgi:hypothetical protein
VVEVIVPGKLLGGKVWSVLTNAQFWEKSPVDVLVFYIVDDVGKNRHNSDWIGVFFHFLFEVLESVFEFAEFKGVYGAESEYLGVVLGVVFEVVKFVGVPAHFGDLFEQWMLIQYFYKLFLWVYL